MLSDLRSTIIKDCCASIITLFSTFGTQFSEFAENVIPKLVILTYNTTSALSEPADECAKSIIIYSRLSIIKFLLATVLKDKHNLARQRCVEYTMIIIQNISSERLQNCLEDIEQIIIAGTFSFFFFFLSFLNLYDYKLRLKPNFFFLLFRCSRRFCRNSNGLKSIILKFY